MQDLYIDNWSDYELIDSGNEEKLERFGKIVLIRPEPQAFWKKALFEKEWKERAHARFSQDTGTKKTNTEDGNWSFFKKVPEKWPLRFHYSAMNIGFGLSFNTFKHVGIFPEQAANWMYIYDSIRSMNIESPKVLNLFAYTGGASLAAAAAGADVYHVDSVKQVITRASENMRLSGLDNIRWVIEDALKFVTREVKRENRYNGIIMDPPAYGRGPAGERWILEEHIDQIIELSAQLLTETNCFFILNMYSMGFSPMIADNLIRTNFPDANPESGELYLKDESDRMLPLGIYSRFRKI